MKKKRTTTKTPFVSVRRSTPEEYAASGEVVVIGEVQGPTNAGDIVPPEESEPNVGYKEQRPPTLYVNAAVADVVQMGIEQLVAAFERKDDENKRWSEVHRNLRRNHRRLMHFTRNVVSGHWDLEHITAGAVQILEQLDVPY